MSAVREPSGRSVRDRREAGGEAPASPAGPVGEAETVRLPPIDAVPAALQALRFAVRPIAFNLRAHRRHGDVWRLRNVSGREPFVVTCHPDHVRSLLTAKPEDAPSLTGESPLRPILGENSILTSVGARHMRQRKLLLPPFHGEAVQRYVEMISAVAEREIDRWPVGQPFALAPRMSAVTLDVIMSGVFGIEGRSAPGSAGHRLRTTIRRMLAASTSTAFQLLELKNSRRREPAAVLRTLLAIVDRRLLAIIAERRAAQGEPGRDVLSLLLEARDEEGRPLTDGELRDELLALVLAGHETTANSLAWTFERLLRTPPAYDRLRELVRSGGPEGEAYVEATIHETMRNRPVIPMIVRLVKRPWRFGEYVVPRGPRSPSASSPYTTGPRSIRTRSPSGPSASLTSSRWMTPATNGQARPEAERSSSRWMTPATNGQARPEAERSSSRGHTRGCRSAAGSAVV